MCERVHGPPDVKQIPEPLDINSVNAATHLGTFNLAMFLICFFCQMPKHIAKEDECLSSVSMCCEVTIIERRMVGDAIQLLSNFINFKQIKLFFCTNY